MSFFNELNNNSLSGVAYKNLNINKSIISYFAQHGNCTIADLCKQLTLSAPKVNNLLTELINDGIVQDYGKINSTGGRRPNIYGLLSNSAYFIGVDIKQDHINIGVSDLQKNVKKIEKNIKYDLQNNQTSLDNLCDIINSFINQNSIPKPKTLGIGINLSGRINYLTGYSYSFFHFNEEPLSKVLESNLGVKVFIENDSRAMAYGEFDQGTVNGEKNVLFINLDHGLGMGIMINSAIYYGKSGFAGELGHTPIFNNEIICKCGKKGCLETEASGIALLRKLKDKINNGSSTSINVPISEITLDDVIKSIQHDDNLSIEIITDIGENLGRGIAILINLFNPELIIIGGKLSETGEHLLLPLKMAINKYSLSVVNADTKIKISSLGNESGVIGACLIARNRVLDFTL